MTDDISPELAAAIADLVGPPPDPTLTLLRELQCRVDDLELQVAHLIERTTP